MTVEVPVTTVWDVAAYALDDLGFWVLSLGGALVIALSFRMIVSRRRGSCRSPQ
ncbi:MAG: hypothetical protein Q4Q58_04890 [Thermoplasmata archaeon]|nr:hypothetical protein [Thermoplasmata archaeon]